MFSLIPELASLLELIGVNDELRLLLELSNDEIKEWMTGQGFDLSKPEFQRKPKQIIQESESKELQIVTEPEFEYSEESDSEEPTHQELFVPVSAPKDFDTAKIQVTTKTYTTSNQIAQSNYSEIVSQEVREDVGIWSEDFVNEFLTKNNSKYSIIIWENKDGESGKPYDFIVIENGIEKFIDVKGTPSSSKDIVYLSPNEWTFMFDKADDYSIYRVYNAGKSDARIDIIENPSELLSHGKIFPNPITLRI
jgi:hypothetical protein